MSEFPTFTLRCSQTGSAIATVYADKYEGRTTASGTKFSQAGMTAAHATLPMGSRVLLLAPNGSKAFVTVNDRLPARNVFDLTKLAASELQVANSRTNVSYCVVADYPVTLHASIFAPLALALVFARARRHARHSNNHNGEREAVTWRRHPLDRLVAFMKAPGTT